MTDSEVCRFVEGAEAAKTSSDHLWYGRALEGIGICMVLLLHLKVDFQVGYYFTSRISFVINRAYRCRIFLYQLSRL